jgi:general secretion pathway protein D
VLLNFGDTVELRVFVDYVAARTRTNFVYDDQLVGSVMLRTPKEVPVSALRSILESLLEFKGLTLVPSPEGFTKVVPIATAASKPTPFFGPDEADRLPDEDVIVTQVIEVKHADLNSVLSALQPILSGVTVSAPAAAATPAYMSTLGPAAGAARVTMATRPTAVGSKIIAVPQHNMLVVTDYAPNVRRLVKLVQTLDVETPQARLELIPLQFIRAEDYAPKILNYVQARYAQAGLQARVAPVVDYDARLNTLIVVALAEDLDAVHSLLADLDVAGLEQERPYRIIRLKNSSAEELLGTLQAVMAAQEKAPVTGAPTATTPETVYPAKPPPPASAAPATTPTPAAGAPAGRTSAPTVVAGTHITAVANKHTNAIILIGPPDEQEVLSAIIEALDVRRPQVMVEALVVEVDASRTLDIGVELSHLTGLAGNRVGGFTSFGFSTFNPNTGAVELGAATGLTGFLVLDSNVTALVNLFLEKVQGKIVSRPRTLVNDNESAAFVSEREEPFVQISALASNTTTTSFGGYEKAGTTLKITPHISEADYLQLEIDVILSAFQGKGTAATPPPRVTNNIQSKVTVPDNCTVLLGGLNRTDQTKTVDKVPLLGDIPILGFLFRHDVNVDTDSILYVFVKARIARAEDFSDLLKLSREASEQVLRQQNAQQPAKRQLPLDQDIYESPAFRPEVDP